MQTKYRTKPLYVEAKQLTSDFCLNGWEESNKVSRGCFVFEQLSLGGTYDSKFTKVYDATVYVYPIRGTLDGAKMAHLNDWIIKYDDGTFDVCTDEEFGKKYEEDIL